MKKPVKGRRQQWRKHRKEAVEEGVSGKSGGNGSSGENVGRRSRMELYVHIPFCVKKCRYCDFLSMPADEDTKTRYVEALCREIEYYGRILKNSRSQETAFPKNERIETIYFGGGTPSVIGADQLVRILKCIREHFDVIEDGEVTVEINPATIDKKGLQKLRENGVNRLSIGLQSTDDAELRLLGRIHDFEDFLRVYEDAGRVGFKNLNVDLISSLPGQSVENYLQSLEKVIELNPGHISAYSLILEEGTPFYETYSQHSELLPDEEEDREMYHLTKEKLQEAGYERYEISNYARPGFKSKHNSGYWNRIPYLGLGLGASSFMNHTRWKNISDLKEYLQIWERKAAEKIVITETKDRAEGWEEQEIPYEEYDVLTLQDEMAEYMYLGLRMSEGVSVHKFEQCFGEKMFRVYGKVLEKLEKQNLLIIDRAGDRICLTDYGMDVSNYVFEEFLIS